jgi:hypothetical protein
MTHDEALRTVAADMHAALQAWTDADNALEDAYNWPDDDFGGYIHQNGKANRMVTEARELTSAVNHRIQELCADSVTGVTLDIGDAE